MPDEDTAESAELPSAGVETCPVLSRFVASHPSLSAHVERVLDAATGVREARARALPPLPVDPDPTIQGIPRPLLDALQALEASLDDETRETSGSRKNGAEPSELASGLARELASLSASSHAFAPPRGSTSPQARAALFVALDLYAKEWPQLVRAARALGVRRLPWQLELATHIAPGTAVRDMRLWGYDIPRTAATHHDWGERCCLTGVEWTTDHHAPSATAGTNQRYRSLDSCHHSLSPVAHRLALRIRRVIDRLEEASLESADLLRTPFPWLTEDFVEETCSPSFARLGLLDFPSLAVSLNNTLRQYGNRPLFRLRTADHLNLPPKLATNSWLTHGAARQVSLSIAHGLQKLGLQAGDRLGILVSRGSATFHLVDFAAIFAGLTSVALPANLSDQALNEILDLTSIQALVAGGGGAERARELSAERSIPCIEFVCEGTAARGADNATTLRSWTDPASIPSAWTASSGIGLATEILYGDRDGEEVAKTQGIQPDDPGDLYTLLFTSGSTGTPKGTPVTRRRWAEEMCPEASIWPLCGASFLAPWTAADRGAVWRAVSNGGRIAFADPGASLFEDLEDIRPTALDAPPVVWNALAADYRRAIADPHLSRSEAAEIRSRTRRRLGGRLVFAAIGGAPASEEVRRVLSDVLEVPLQDGYGTTETGSIASNGRLLAGLDYRLLPVPALGFDPKDPHTGRGELAVRTARTTARYAHETSGASDHYTDDGYFKTGDLVEVDADRRLRHLGRHKQFFKLAAGNFVAPEELELLYASSDRIRALFLAPDPGSEGLVAVVIPEHADVSEGEILEDMRLRAQRHGLDPTCIPTAVVLDPSSVEGKEGGIPWNQENGLLTASLKINRLALAAAYRERIAAAWMARGARQQETITRLASSASLESDQLRLASLAAALLARDVDAIDLDRSFLDQGGDSLSSMDFTLRLEEVFAGRGRPWSADPRDLVGLPLRRIVESLAGDGGAGSNHRPAIAPPGDAKPPPETAPAPDRSPAAAITATDSAVSSSPPSANETDRIQQDADWTPKVPCWSEAAPLGDILVTGATGFLGAHLVADLVDRLADSHPGRRVIVLIRASDGVAACQRLAATFERFDLPQRSLGHCLEDDARVIALAGSLSRESLGLPPETWDALARCISLIFHVGAQVSSELSYEELRSSNVLGTQRLLTLATTHRSKAMHFVSTLNVGMLLERTTGRTTEEEASLPETLPTQVIESSLAYAVSKWVSERNLQRLFAESGGSLRLSVSRPALLTWSTRSGLGNDDDWFSRILATCLDIGATVAPPAAGGLRWSPETDTSARGLDLVPIDFTARSVAALGLATEKGQLPPPSRPTSEPRVPTFHLSNTALDEGGLTTWKRLMDLLVQASLEVDARSLAPLDLTEWASRAEITSAPVVPVLHRLRRSWPQYPRVRSQRFLAAVGERCPPVDISYVRRYLESRPR
ncbi:MAG: AMP-binding protein [Thermoanaerobaculia bacterium]|nr:AMP-binding protein [Thermoanaerobaculia bacterium]